MATSHRSRASTITANQLRRIADGDLTAPKSIAKLLKNALEARDYSACLKNLKGLGIDPQSYINGLEKAIEILSPGSDIHDRCVREQGRACKIYGLLPDSHKIQSTLTKGQHPVASGGFSDVWKATNENGEVFAVKAFRMYESNAEQVKKKYCREVVRSRSMSHPNILRIEGGAPDLFSCCMVSKWMENGNMLEYLNQNEGHIDRLELLLGIIRGLDYLHGRKIVHGGLKGYNIFISAEGTPCLADFGLCSIARDIYSVIGSDVPSGGSARWSAPELVEPTTKRDVVIKPTMRSDIYSLAMVVVEAFTGRIPFPNATDAYVVLTITRGGRPQKPTNCESLGLGPAVWGLTEDCWSQNPKNRPDIQKVLRRFQVIFCAGEEKRSSPLIERIKSIGMSFNDSAQQRINRLDQDLEKGVIPESERPGKLNELCTLCGNNKLIPDSMKLQGYSDDSGEVKEYQGPSSVHQSKFKGRKVAIKVTRVYIAQKLEDPLVRFCKEAVSWKHLHHPNILPLVGATITKNRLCFISEWMDQGNIIQYLKAKGNLEVNRIELLIDVVDGLSHMHGLQVVHGNLKGANIYIKNFRACIAGFSASTIARQWDDTASIPTDSLPTFTSSGSLRWMSPELLDPSRLEDRDPRPTKESDRFALGMVIYEVLCGHVPYDGWETERINDAILQGVRPYKPDAAARLGLVDELWDLLLLCWEERREARPSLPTIRACLEEVVPLWHVRETLSSTMEDDTDSESLNTRSDRSVPPSPSPSPSPLPPSIPPS